METPEAAAKVATSIWNQLIGAPAHLLLLLVLLIVGILIKKSPTPNWLIPWILITLGAVGYPFLSSGKFINEDFPNPVLVLRLYGGLLGIGAILAHMALKKSDRYRAIENGIVNAFRDDENKIKPPDETDPKKPDQPT